LIWFGLYLVYFNIGIDRIWFGLDLVDFNIGVERLWLFYYLLLVFAFCIE